MTPEEIEANSTAIMRMLSYAWRDAGGGCDMGRNQRH